MAKSARSRYQRLVAGFAASAFALLGILSSLQHEANTVSAATIRNANTMTTYRENCMARMQRIAKRTGKAVNYRLCVGR